MSSIARNAKRLLGDDLTDNIDPTSDRNTSFFMEYFKFVMCIHAGFVPNERLYVYNYRKTQVFTTVLNSLNYES
jgi:hypothetical protein